MYLNVLYIFICIYKLVLLENYNSTYYLIQLKFLLSGTKSNILSHSPLFKPNYNQKED